MNKIISNKNCLVIEDNKMVSEYISSALKNYYKVIHNAFSFDDALKHIQHFRYSLIIFDNDLGSDDTGLDLLKFMHNTPENRAKYVRKDSLFLANSGDSTANEEMRDMYGCKIWGKPSGFDRLRQLLAGVK